MSDLELSIPSMAFDSTLANFELEIPELAFCAVHSPEYPVDQDPGMLFWLEQDGHLDRLATRLRRLDLRDEFLTALDSATPGDLSQLPAREDVDRLVSSLTLRVPERKTLDNDFVTEVC